MGGMLTTDNHKDAIRSNEVVRLTLVSDHDNLKTQLPGIEQKGFPILPSFIPDREPAHYRPQDMSCVCDFPGKCICLGDWDWSRTIDDLN
uniref:Uncharacterized protein n=1 Tax=Picea glauca TaxID=3330 RepID=A0A101LV08_PICGL|nr:hypothetical protein ABT39_MTgene2204 [Picea glauca]QHR87800.1 hypothetical protein Q903MT_gene1812 [Picea sitchensis]